MIVNFALSKPVLSIIFLLLFGYFFGSIPSGYLAGKWIKGIDLRQYGSGTVSGSMVWEHVAKWAVVPVGLFDIFKGAFPTWLGLRLGMGELAAMLAGFAAIVGHNWSIYLNFQGGRGFSPFLGELLVLFPWGLVIVLAGLAIGNIFQNPIFPLFTVLLLPFFAQFLQDSPIVLWCSLGMTLITLIKRLEANRRPLPADRIERQRTIIRRLLLDRDIQDHEEWIRQEPR
jgi:glycerol-3-phosphate acyltransferase PlsY